MEVTVDDPRDLQTDFIGALCRERIPVSIYLVSGIRLQGTVEDFDRFTLALRNVSMQIVYKHAISTIVPSRQPESSGPPPDESG